MRQRQPAFTLATLDTTLEYNRIKYQRIQHNEINSYFFVMRLLWRIIRIRINIIIRIRIKIKDIQYINTE